MNSDRAHVQRAPARNFVKSTLGLRCVAPVALKIPADASARTGAPVSVRSLGFTICPRRLPRSLLGPLIYSSSAADRMLNLSTSSAITSPSRRNSSSSSRVPCPSKFEYPSSTAAPSFTQRGTA